MTVSFRDHKTTSFISESTEMEGELDVSGGIRIDGVIRGCIRSESVVYVGDGAVIEADITAEALIASGEVNGTVHAAKQILVNLPGSISGDVKTQELVLEKGVNFNGTCEILDPAD